VLLVQLELESEGLIRHTPPALEHRDRLVEDLLKGPHYLSRCRCGVQRPCRNGQSPSGAFIPQMVEKRKPEVLGARDAA
jgi:hypothetical protein